MEAKSVTHCSATDGPKSRDAAGGKFCSLQTVPEMNDANIIVLTSLVVVLNAGYL